MKIYPEKFILYSQLTFKYFLLNQIPKSECRNKLTNESMKTKRLKEAAGYLLLEEPSFSKSIVLSTFEMLMLGMIYARDVHVREA